MWHIMHQSRQSIFSVNLITIYFSWKGMSSSAHHCESAKANTGLVWPCYLCAMLNTYSFLRQVSNVVWLGVPPPVQPQSLDLLPCQLSPLTHPKGPYLKKLGAVVVAPLPLGEKKLFWKTLTTSSTRFSTFFLFFFFTISILFFFTFLQIPFMLKDIKSCENIIMTVCRHAEIWELVLQLVNMLVCFYLFVISINFLRAISHHAACWLLRLSHCQCNCQKLNNWNVSIFIIPINIFLDFYDIRRVRCIILIETLCEQMSTTYAPMCIC